MIQRDRHPRPASSEAGFFALMATTAERSTTFGLLVSMKCLSPYVLRRRSKAPQISGIVEPPR
jgi:hypothetical protein